MNPKKAISSVIATCLVAASALAAAGPQEGNAAPVVSRTVRYGDLDLATREGQQALEKRLGLAATDICRISVPMDPGQFIQHGVCRRALIDKALATVRRDVAQAQAQRQSVVARSQEIVRLEARPAAP